MKNIFKKSICFLICILITCSSVSVVAAAGEDAPYPAGVTPEQTFVAINGTDILLNNAILAFGGTSLKDIVYPMLYNSHTLSMFVVGFYSSLEEMAGDLEKMGVDISVNSVANALVNYPQISAALMQFASWSEVDLNGVDWGVTEKYGFLDALGVAFSPLNDIFYMLLCSGTYEISRFFKLTGGDGYTNTVVPMLKALNCPDILTTEQFVAEADTDRNNMIKNIILPLLNFVDLVLMTPANTLSETLPGFSFFVESGQLESCTNALIEPIKANRIVEIAIWLKLIDPDSFSFDVKGMFSSLLTADIVEGFKLKEFDLVALSNCGSLEESGFVPDKGKAYVQIMRWLIDTIKLNPDMLTQVMGKPDGEKNSSLQAQDLIKDILSKDTDTILSTLILLFTPTQVTGAQGMIYPSVTPTYVQYTPNLTKENFEKVLVEIDGILNEFVKEGGQYSSVESLLRRALFTNANINSLVVGIYKALEENGMTDLLEALGTDISPKGVASAISNKYAKVAHILSKSEAWADVSLTDVSWGFDDGSRKGFENAFAAVLRPLFPMLRFLLAEEDIVILNTITIKGADGYNTGVIPILEALGCSSFHIKNYADYKKAANTDGIIKNIISPVLDLLEDVCEKPVYTLTEILPNIVYFLNTGSIEKCISNLLLPVTTFADKMKGVYEINADFSSLKVELDINQLLKGMLDGTGMMVADFDVNKLATVGTPQQLKSKSTLNGESVYYTYVEADKTGVLMLILRLLARTIKMPGNENLLVGAMGDGNQSMAMYSDSVSQQFASMTEDELIEWLYNLLFKERVRIEIVTGEDDYKPTIIYNPPEKDYTAFYFVGAYLTLAGIVGLIIFFNRKRLYK